jgi:ADP-ribosylation factor GTPase-activating protein 2/3
VFIRLNEGYILSYAYRWLFFHTNFVQYERNQASTRFENSSSISSDDYFGNNSGNKGNKNSASFGSNLTSYAPDMQFLKQDLKDGVSRVAGKLSNMATTVYSQLQVNLGVSFFSIFFFLLLHH